MMEETLFLTMNLIDRFLAVQLVIRKKLQLVGITTLLLACKYEEFNIIVPTTYVFMRQFLKASQSDKMLCLVEYAMLRFPPSILTAAAVFTAQCTLGVSREWNATCEKHNSSLECSKLLVSFHQKVAVGKLTGVHQKYSTSKYGNAARCEPASFLLEA
ncbi:hypothetical protein CQW23_28474 [Capsicum baccatum]|uniref:Cyclin C-terminal domain-containing protein n=1 Tax=Capsicum baccatum TaxID=33114 RepID=A0A2G2VGQ2_CAPBA|nr:hypothetical protein CQW23_28474 [Capsicum baccatum]